MTREPLFEGPCAYAVKAKRGYEVIIYSTNAVQHVSAGAVPDVARAERLCRRLNAYPAKARQFHGLL
jgi:hypothetical protein